jgi:AraC family transcriptional regulator
MKDAILYQLITAIMAEIKAAPLSNLLKMEYLTRALAAHLLTRHSTTGRTGYKVPTHALNACQIGAINDYISNNLASNLSISELASLVRMSRARFIQRFKATVQITPYQFVLLRRVRQACKLLLLPDMDYTSIALLCGFVDQSHFIALFKRITGMTPGEYRRIRFD